MGYKNPLSTAQALFVYSFIRSPIENVISVFTSDLSHSDKATYWQKLERIHTWQATVLESFFDGRWRLTHICSYSFLTDSELKVREPRT